MHGFTQVVGTRLYRNFLYRFLLVLVLNEMVLVIIIVTLTSSTSTITSTIFYAERSLVPRDNDELRCDPRCLYP